MHFLIQHRDCQELCNNFQIKVQFDFLQLKGTRRNNSQLDSPDRIKEASVRSLFSKYFNKLGCRAKLSPDGLP